MMTDFRNTNNQSINSVHKRLQELREERIALECELEEMYDERIKDKKRERSLKSKIRQIDSEINNLKHQSMITRRSNLAEPETSEVL